MPDFARRHYTALAKVIRDQHDQHDTDDTPAITDALDAIADALADLFEDDNPSGFDRTRFILATQGTTLRKTDMKG